MVAAELVELASGEPYATCSQFARAACPTDCWWCDELQLCAPAWQACAVTSTPSDGSGGSSTSGGLLMPAVFVLLLACAAVAYARMAQRPTIELSRAARPPENLMGGYVGSAHQDLWRGGDERTWAGGALEPPDDATYEQQRTPASERGCGGRESPAASLAYPMASLVHPRSPSIRQPEGERLLDTV